MAKKKNLTVKELRAEQKLSQAAFAKALGISSSTVASYEAGKTNPSQAVVDKIKELYNVTIKVEKAEAAKEDKKPAEAKKPAKKAEVKAEEKAVEEKPAEEAPAAVEEKPAEPAPVEEKPVEKKEPKKAPAKKESAKKAPAKKEPAKKAPAKKAAAVPEVIIQYDGNEITTADIIAKVGEADKIYVRADEKKAYWVKGEETGSVDL